MQLGFNALCANSEVPNRRSATVGTELDHWPPAIAAMTNQRLVDSVVNERDVAAPTVDDVSTVAARDTGCGTATIDEEDRLLAPLERLRERLPKRTTEDVAVAGHQLLAQVDNGNG